MDGPLKTQTIDCASEADWATAIADRLGAALMRALDRDPRALLIVPGGRTPGPILRELAGRDLPWSRIDILPSDERWVAPDHPESNAANIRRDLLQGRAAAASFHALYRALPAPSLAAREIADDLRALPLPAAAILLGMGEDGHIASLFPGGDFQGDGFLVASDRPIKGWPRMSLALPLLSAAQKLIVAIRGMEKRAVIAKALRETSDLPIASLLRAAARPVDIFHCP